MKYLNSRRAFTALVSFLAASFVSEIFGDDLTYEVVGDTVKIIDCKKTASGALVIPSSYDGKPISSIGERALEGCGRLTGVTIPDSVTSIGSYALSDCSRLTSVTIPDSLTPAFLLGVDGKVKSELGRIGMRLGIGKHASEGCSGLTSVTIPCLFFQYFETNSVIKFGFKKLFQIVYLKEI